LGISGGGPKYLEEIANGSVGVDHRQEGLQGRLEVGQKVGRSKSEKRKLRT